MTQLAFDAAEIIRQRRPNFEAKIGIILGSGLGPLAEQIEHPTIISYGDLPGFNHCTVQGHAGKLFLGDIEGMPVACMQGRAHYYEGVDHETYLTMIRTFKLLGCDTLITTNAAGSLREEVLPGEVVLIHDHINMQGRHPLLGKNDDRFGSKFFSMEDAYDSVLRKKMLHIARDLQIELTEGVYLSVLGPNFETPAEIHAFKLMGADLVGMSTVPEVITARHCGLRVVALSAVTNLAAGFSEQKLSHELTLSGAKLATEKLFKLVQTLLRELAHEKNQSVS